MIKHIFESVICFEIHKCFTQKWNHDLQIVNLAYFFLSTGGTSTGGRGAVCLSVLEEKNQKIGLLNTPVLSTTCCVWVMNQQHKVSYEIKTSCRSDNIQFSFLIYL